MRAFRVFNNVNVDQIDSEWWYKDLRIRKVVMFLVLLSLLAFLSATKAFGVLWGLAALAAGLSTALFANKVISRLDPNLYLPEITTLRLAATAMLWPVVTNNPDMRGRGIGRL